MALRDDGDFSYRAAVETLYFFRIDFRAAGLTARTKVQNNCLLLASRVLKHPGLEAVSEEVELDVWILTSSLSIPAVDDLDLRRMHFEKALCQTGLKCGLESQGFLLTPAVNQSIVCIPAPREVRVCPCHPKKMPSATGFRLDMHNA
jgi:hypothetical protein